MVLPARNRHSESACVSHPRTRPRIFERLLKRSREAVVSPSNLCAAQGPGPGCSSSGQKENEQRQSVMSETGRSAIDRASIPTRADACTGLPARKFCPDHNKFAPLPSAPPATLSQKQQKRGRGVTRRGCPCLSILCA